MRSHADARFRTQGVCLVERFELRRARRAEAATIVHSLREHADLARAGDTASYGRRSKTRWVPEARSLLRVSGMETSIARIERRGEDGEVELRDLIDRYQVAWTVRPELAVHDSTLRPIGFVVELIGTHHDPKHVPSAGCSECRPVKAALARIAHAVLPREERPSWYDVLVEPGLAFEHGRMDRPEITATITVLHRGTIDRPIDACERVCAEDIGRRLTALGARRR